MQRSNFEVQHYINGEFVDEGDRLEVFYPARGETIRSAPEGTTHA
jgi:hypothetical protein